MVAKAFKMEGYEKLGSTHIVYHKDLNPNNNHLTNLTIVPKGETPYFIEEKVEVRTKPIPWAEHYTVSEDGNVYKKGKKLKTTQESEKIFTVLIQDKKYQLDKLVCSIFYPINNRTRYEEYIDEEVVHRNGWYHDNTFTNLQWKIRKPNLAIRGNLVLQFNKDGEYMNKFPSVRQAQLASGETVYKIKKSADGAVSEKIKYAWVYADEINLEEKWYIRTGQKEKTFFTVEEKVENGDIKTEEEEPKSHIEETSNSLRPIHYDPIENIDEFLESSSYKIVFTNLYKKYGIIPRDAVNEESGVKLKILYTCVCGTDGVAVMTSFYSSKFCRNEKCNYFQQAKRLDQIEVKIKLESEKQINITRIDGTGINAVIHFTCTCGFEQSNTYRSLEREKYCKHFACDYYGRQKNYTAELVKAYFLFENYSCETEVEYKSEKGWFFNHKYNLKCPVGHPISVSMDNWVNGKRCKICNGDGRTLSYNNIVSFYGKYGCRVVYDETDYKGNVTVEKVPFLCPQDHLIENLTKNMFNARINQKLNPCKLCTDITEKIRKSKKTCLRTYGVEFCSQYLPVFTFQQQQTFTRKPYTLPSGKIIYIQGDENYCLDILLRKYNETDILYERKEIPIIKYEHPEHKDIRTYYPDFYIKKDNIIVEVKSTYTLEIDEIKNRAKFDAVLKTGYQFDLYVFNAKKKLEYKKEFRI